MNKINEIQNLNKICQLERYGLYKQWIYKNEDYLKMCDYMQKISYSISDLNGLIPELNKFDRKNVLYVIVLVDWIREAYNAIYKKIDPRVLTGFVYSKEKELKQHNEYFKALRSFVVAHPLETTAHSKYELDGNWICIDIGEKLYNFFNDTPYYLDICGLHKGKNERNDFYLTCYSNSADNMRYSKQIGCSYCDVFKVAELYIDKLHELDSYLVKNIKRKEYE